MHENEISEKIIGAVPMQSGKYRKMQKNNSIQMYQLLMLSHGVHLRGLRFVRQQSVPISYKGIKLGTDLRLDLLIEEKVIVDLKAKDKLSPIDKPNLDKPEFQVSNFKFQIYNNPCLPKSLPVRARTRTGNGGQVCDLCASALSIKTLLECRYN